jgi:hypothetical protein
MSEERKIEAFSARRTRNGGWLIMIRDDRLDRVGTIAPEYAYSSDHDMLAALPELIGAGPSLAELETLEAIAKSQMRDVEVLDGYRFKDGYENGD